MVSPHLHDGETTSGQPDRWTTVLAHLTAAIPPGAAAHRGGWYLDRYDDAPHRFLALATRRR